MFSRTTCMIANVKKKLDQIFGFNRFIVAIQLFPFLVKLLMRNLFQGHFVSLHYASLLCIILHEKCTPTYANGRFLVFFFCQEEKLWSPRKRTWWPIIHIFCLQSSEKLEKNIFHTISNLGEKQRHSLKMKTCKGTCSTYTVVLHS